MVIPLYDDNSGRQRNPFVNYSLIAINVLVFIFLQDMGAADNRFTYTWATVPQEILTGHDVKTNEERVVHPITGETYRRPGLGETPVSVYLTLIVSMFMHGSWLHLIGNMLFLWVFGDNVEDYLGHIRYVVFYLLCGVVASLAHVLATYTFGFPADIPCLGASGAVSGILGSYLLLYPHRRVLVFAFRFIMYLPAYLAIGTWFLFQLIYGLGSIGDKSGGGVAYGAHIGGFLFGLVAVKMFAVGAQPETYSRVPKEY